MKRTRLINAGTFIAITVIIEVLLVAGGCSISNKSAYSVEISLNKRVTRKFLEPDDHFAKALNAFAGNDFDTSYKEIRKGINYMEGVSAVSKGVYKKKIDESIDELSELADYVRFDKVDGIDELNYFFARAGRALGDNHTWIVEKIIPDHNSDRNGYTLDIHIKNLDKPLSVSRRDYAYAEDQLIADAGKLMKEMAAKYHIHTLKINRAISDLKTSFTSLG